MPLVDKYIRLPEEIERESFSRIDVLLKDLSLPAGEAQVVKRMVHAAGDPTIVEDVRLHPQFVARGVDALRAGATIYTDVAMVAVGISPTMCQRLGCRVVCAMDLPGVAQRAAQEGVTRAIAAFRSLGPSLDGSLVAIGNAPTALLALLDLVDEGIARPAAILGLPVGFVSAAESKEELVRRNVPYITLLGTRGGSTLTVAAVNALLRLALNVGNA
jgi:precorrin-8X/cobalt-precorrin-8 methylmutase